MNFLQLLYHAQFHGANRLADKTSRWYFIPPMLSLLLSAVLLVIFTINRYLDNPTYIVHFEKFFRSRPFPSVVLCPEIAFSDSKIDEFLSEMKYPSSKSATDFRDILPQLAAFYSPDTLYEMEDLMRLEELLYYNDISVEEAGLRLTATCEEILIKCRFGRKFMNCSEIFTMELTGAGFCCVFNARSLKREMENSDVYKKTPMTYDSRWNMFRFGYVNSLMVAVNQSQQKPLNIDLYYKWIALQTSHHFVDTANNGTPLNPGCEQWISYHTNNFKVGVEVKELSTSLRKCNMAVDGLLKYFPIYNKQYCLLECEMANTLRQCKCLRTVHPKPPGASRCRAAKLRCALNAMVPYDNELCHCLSTCEVEMVYTKASSSFVLKSMVKPLDSFYNDLDFDKVTIVRVFIENRKQNIRQRTSYFTYLDLFSQLGGVFNVFFGCSILTLIGFLQIGWHTILSPFRRNTNK